MARVLIADDAEFMRAVLAKIIVQLGHVVAGEAETGDEAVRMFQQLRPDLVTMDIVMPEKDGLEALKQIMIMDPKAKVIMVTALGQETLVLDAVKAGACEFVIKPFKPTELVRAIEKTLA